MSRAILVVMDGCGIGALPDASEYGDADVHSNTLRHVVEYANLRLPTLASLGLFRLLAMISDSPLRGAFGRCAQASKGKDSAAGHCELMGIVASQPAPTYPDGFPTALIAEFERSIGRRVLGNIAASGTDIIARLGAENLRTGMPIVYTSADSVFQIAAHEEAMTAGELESACLAARAILTGSHAVQRVIARPFAGDPTTGFVRTNRRKDYPLPPPEPNILTALRAAGRRVHGIGVVVDLFPRRYFDIAERTQSNAEHFAAIERAVESGDADFVFANCEDFDMLYGHRNDPAGFADALRIFDRLLAGILDKLRPDDLLLLSADHGNDPTIPGTDHSREFVPLLACGAGAIPGRDLGERATFADAGATVARVLGATWNGPGTSAL